MHNLRQNGTFKHFATVAQPVEHLRDKWKAWVQILASVAFLFFEFFLPCYPDEALKGPILIGVLHSFMMLIQKDIKN